MRALKLLALLSLKDLYYLVRIRYWYKLVIVKVGLSQTNLKGLKKSRIKIFRVFSYNRKLREFALLGLFQYFEGGA